MEAVEYSTREVPPERGLARAFFRVAVACGVLPMLAGPGILFFYWLTKNDGWVWAGLWTIPIGAGVVLLGIAFILVYIIRSWRIARVEGVRFRKLGVALALLLLLGNIPVAVVCALEGIDLMSTVYVDVLNESGAPLESCIVECTGGITKSRGPFPAGGRFRATYREGFWGDPARVTVYQAGKKLESVSTPGVGWVRFHIRPGLTCVTETVN